MRELKNTIEMMIADDYKEQFKAEFYQLDIRRVKLERILKNKDKNNFYLSCPITLLQKQYDLMLEYEKVLLERARIEGIEL